MTGSGPETWTHNHKKDGIHDLCGNIWEMVRGFRIKNGVLQAAKDNDAAMDIDLTCEGDDWFDVVDDEGNPIYVHVEDGEIALQQIKIFLRDMMETIGEMSHQMQSQQLESLDCGMERKMRIYVDSTDGEYLPAAVAPGSMAPVRACSRELEHTRTTPQPHRVPLRFL